MLKPELLITDCNKEMCDVYRQFLAQFGYAVETASDGLDCLRKLDLVKPTVLVLDRDLPWGGGDGVLACLREETPAFEMPVILTAPSATWQDADQFIEAPVVEYLPKPFTLISLLESICSAIAKKGRSELFNRNRFRLYSELFSS